ncbi:MAG: hypothetical protein ACRCWJ_14590, partial [Casimicrobium sp.]
LRYHGVEDQKKVDLSSDAAIKWMLQHWIDRCAELGIPTTHAIGFTQSRRGGKKQAESIQRIGLMMGLNFTIVGDDTTQEDFEVAEAMLESGQVNLLCNQLLTTGWDAPYLRHALVFRKIPSRDRCIQAATRVDRRHPSKDYGEIWDFAGNFQLAGEDSGLHPKVEDLSDAVGVSVLAPKFKSDGEAPRKVCSNSKCSKTIFASQIECPHCRTIQPARTALYEDAKGRLVSFIPEAQARQGRSGLRAYFRQQRKIAFALGWSPFAACYACEKLGLKVAIDDSEMWLGSVGVSRESYQRYLDANARSWKWDEAKKQREIIREFGRE